MCTDLEAELDDVREALDDSEKKLAKSRRENHDQEAVMQEALASAKQIGDEFEMQRELWNDKQTAMKSEIDNLRRAYAESRQALDESVHAAKHSAQEFQSRISDLEQSLREAQTSTQH
eukprot:GABV01006259.1.p1 GENE.GABV01006259.1~~GABV01006259.1.p1  ORF type:complete len:127 (+),score=53.55 GABV01006259.1:28-381(+)